MAHYEILQQLRCGGGGEDRASVSMLRLLSATPSVLFFIAAMYPCLPVLLRWAVTSCRGVLRWSRKALAAHTQEPSNGIALSIAFLEADCPFSCLSLPWGQDANCPWFNLNPVFKINKGPSVTHPTKGSPSAFSSSSLYSAPPPFFFKVNDSLCHLGFFFLFCTLSSPIFLAEALWGMEERLQQQLLLLLKSSSSLFLSGWMLQIQGQSPATATDLESLLSRLPVDFIRN